MGPPKHLLTQAEVEDGIYLKARLFMICGQVSFFKKPKKSEMWLIERCYIWKGVIINGSLRMSNIKNPLGIGRNGERVPIRPSVKRAVFNRAGGKCEYRQCGIALKWGSKGTGETKGVFHHIRNPSISPTEKTVVFVCPNHHSVLHEYKTKKEHHPFFGEQTKREIKRKDPRTKPKKARSKSLRRKHQEKRKLIFQTFRRYCRKQFYY